MTFRGRLVILGVALFGCVVDASRVSGQSPRLLAADSIAIRDVLDYFKSGNSRGAAADRFSLKRAGHWRAKELLTRLGQNGVAFGDVNAKDTVWTASRQQIERELTAHRGRSLSALAYLAYIYAQPYPQYSGLQFRSRGRTIRVRVGEIHELVFERQSDSLRLTAVRLVQRQGE